MWHVHFETFRWCFGLGLLSVCTAQFVFKLFCSEKAAKLDTGIQHTRRSSPLLLLPVALPCLADAPERQPSSSCYSTAGNGRPGAPRDAASAVHSPAAMSGAARRRHRQAFLLPDTLLYPFPPRASFNFSRQSVLTACCWPPLASTSGATATLADDGDDARPGTAAATATHGPPPGRARSAHLFRRGGRA